MWHVAQSPVMLSRWAFTWHAAQLPKRTGVVIDDAVWHFAQATPSCFPCRANVVFAAWSKVPFLKLVSSWHDRQSSLMLSRWTIA